jgi:hypothetical protein
VDPTWERRPTSETPPAPTKKLSTILPQSTDSPQEARHFQPMPELTTEQYDALKAVPLAEDERQSLLATISGAQ